MKPNLEKRLYIRTTTSNLHDLDSIVKTWNYKTRSEVVRKLIQNEISKIETLKKLDSKN